VLTPTLDMLDMCFLDRLRWCVCGGVAVERCCEPAADEEPGGEVSLWSVPGPVTSVLEETRPSMCLTFCDLERLCLGVLDEVLRNRYVLHWQSTISVSRRNTWAP
jgi:hypothetical protein